MANKGKPFSDNDVANPRITFHAPGKTFDRLLKERSLSDLKETVRKKLGLGSGSVVQFTQLRKGKRVDLEDEDDFDAFCAIANEQRHATIHVALTENSVAEGSSVDAKGSTSLLPPKSASALPSYGHLPANSSAFIPRGAVPYKKVVLKNEDGIVVNVETVATKMRQLEEKERLRKEDEARELHQKEKKQKKKESLRRKKEEKRRREQEEQNRQNLPATNSSTSIEASSPSTRPSPLPSINQTSQHPLPSTESSYQLPLKSAWFKGPPQTASVPSRFQFPAPSVQPQPSSTLGQGVSVQDGASVPHKYVGAVKQVGSIDDAPSSTSPATAPPVKSEGVHAFGSVPNTRINGKAPVASPAAGPSTSTPSTSTSSASVSTSSIPAIHSSVTPKSKFDVNKLFQNPSSQPSNSSTSTETSSPATPNASPSQVASAVSSPRLGAHPSIMASSPMAAPMQPPVPWPSYCYDPEQQHQHYMQTCYCWDWAPPQMSPATQHLHQHPPHQTPPPSVAPPSRLALVKPLEDLGAVTYPEGIKGPKPEFNIAAKGGKFRYDRDFLLQFMSICKETPVFLFPLDALGLESMPSHKTRSKRGEKKSEASKAAAAATAARSWAPNLEPFAPLSVTENRWDRKSFSNNDPDSLQVVDAVKALLDKLPMGGFDSISGQIIQWVNRSENQKDGRTLVQVTRLVFEKVTDDALSGTYARLCMKIMEQINPKVQDEGIRNSEGNPITGGQLFRQYLLNRCQEDFERGWFAKEVTTATAAAKAAEDRVVKAADESSESGEIALYSKEYYAAQMAKRQSLGLIKFIGELFKRQMLTERTMHECIQKLLNNAVNPLEEDIECLCTLVTMIGGLLDTRKARTHIDIYFQRMQEIGKNVSPRTQSMLQDVLELRKRNWQVRKAVVAPTTIVQVHETL